MNAPLKVIKRPKKTKALKPESLPDFLGGLFAGGL
jgi:hypothetical protein